MIKSLIVGTGLSIMNLQRIRYHEGILHACTGVLWLFLSAGTNTAIDSDWIGIIFYLTRMVYPVRIYLNAMATKINIS